MSPRLKLLLSTATPFFDWPDDVLDSDIPKCENTYVVNPEQSKPFDGDEPPDTYLYPKYCFAYATIDSPVVPVAEFEAVSSDAVFCASFEVVF